VNTGARREPGMDALRTLAVLSMMAAHTSRLIVFEARQEWSYVVLLLEPLIPTLFLFLVGLSLTHSRRKADGDKTWVLRQAKRALLLWGISAVFFSAEQGVCFPDVLLDSGILCTIAYAIVWVGILLLVPKPAWALGSALGIGVVAFCLIDRAGARPFLWVSGNSPLFPLLLFAMAGALWGLALRRFPRALPWLGLPALVLATWMIHRYGWETLFTRPFGRSDATRVLSPPLTGGTAVSVPYYNLRPVLALMCLSLHLAALGLTKVLRIGEIWASRLFALGRHALQAYMLHLFLLALIVVRFGLHPLHSAAMGNAVLIGVAAICWGWSLLRERGWPRYRRGTQSSNTASASDSGARS
jgi:hypothetical protein